MCWLPCAPETNPTNEPRHPLWSATDFSHLLKDSFHLSQLLACISSAWHTANHSLTLEHTVSQTLTRNIQLVHPLSPCWRFVCCEKWSRSLTKRASSYTIVMPKQGLETWASCSNQYPPAFLHGSIHDIDALFYYNLVLWGKHYWPDSHFTSRAFVLIAQVTNHSITRLLWWCDTPTNVFTQSF